MVLLNDERIAKVRCIENNEAYSFYHEKYPDQTETELYELTCQFVAPIEVAGHTTGGAIDLTLLKDGKEIEMGSGFNETPIAPQNLTYTYSKSISETAKKNRQILIQSMEQVGFINYPPEWWHWSYGDRYWAFMKHCEAIYGPTDEQQIIKDKSCTYLTK